MNFTTGKSSVNSMISHAYFQEFFESFMCDWIFSSIRSKTKFLSSVWFFSKMQESKEIFKNKTSQNMTENMLFTIIVGAIIRHKLCFHDQKLTGPKTGCTPNFRPQSVTPFKNKVQLETKRWITFSKIVWEREEVFSLGKITQWLMDFFAKLLKEYVLRRAENLIPTSVDLVVQWMKWIYHRFINWNAFIFTVKCYLETPRNQFWYTPQSLNWIWSALLIGTILSQKERNISVRFQGKDPLIVKHGCPYRRYGPVRGTDFIGAVNLRFH